MSRNLFHLFLVCAVAVWVCPSAQAAEDAKPVAVAEKKEADKEEEKVDPYAVPQDATAKELAVFIVKVSRPSSPIRTSKDRIEFFSKSAKAKVEAGGKLLEIGETDSQLAMAVKAKANGLSILGQLGDAGAKAESQEFVKAMLTHEVPAVARAAKRLDLDNQLRSWKIMIGRQRVLKDDEELDPKYVFTDQQKKNLFKDLGGLLEGELNLIDVRLASNTANFVGDTPDSAMAISLIEGLIPRLHSSESKPLASMAPKLEGLARRMRLPGSFMEVDGALLSGDQVDWSEYRGKVVLVDFWATWCGPCIRELPNVKDNYTKYHEKGFDVLAISLDTKPEAVEKFLEKHEIPWVTLFSADKQANGWNHPMATKYGIRGIPRAILVDQQGNVVHMNARGAELGKQLQLLLGDPVAKDTKKPGETAQAAVAQP